MTFLDVTDMDSQSSNENIETAQQKITVFRCFDLGTLILLLFVSILIGGFFIETSVVGVVPSTDSHMHVPQQQKQQQQPWVILYLILVIAIAIARFCFCLQELPESIEESVIQDHPAAWYQSKNCIILHSKNLNFLPFYQRIF